MWPCKRPQTKTCSTAADRVCGRSACCGSAMESHSDGHLPCLTQTAERAAEYGDGRWAREGMVAGERENGRWWAREDGGSCQAVQVTSGWDPRLAPKHQIKCQLCSASWGTRGQFKNQLSTKTARLNLKKWRFFAGEISTPMHTNFPFLGLSPAGTTSHGYDHCSSDSAVRLSEWHERPISRPSLAQPTPVPPNPVPSSAILAAMDQSTRTQPHMIHTTHPRTPPLLSPNERNILASFDHAPSTPVSNLLLPSLPPSRHQPPTPLRLASGFGNRHRSVLSLRALQHPSILCNPRRAASSTASAFAAPEPSHPHPSASCQRFWQPPPFCTPVATAQLRRAQALALPPQLCGRRSSTMHGTGMGTAFAPLPQTALLPA